MKTKVKIEKCIDTFAILFFFVAVFAYMPTARSGDRIVWIVAIAFLLLMAAKNVFFHKTTVSLDSSFLWYTSLVAWGALTCFWSLYTSRFENYFQMYFLVVVLAIIALSTFMKSEKDIDRMFYLIIIAGCIAAIRFMAYTPWDTIFAEGYYSRGTFGSLLDNVTNYNNYINHLCIICVISAFYSIVRKNKWCYLAFVFLCCVLILGGARKNLLVIPVAILIFALSTGNFIKKLKSLIIAAVIISIGTYFIMTIDLLEPVKNSLIGMFNGFIGEESGIVDTSTYERLYLIETAKEVWGEHFLLGVGWDNFCYYNMLHLYAHNNYYELLASTGIIGFMIYYFYYIFRAGQIVTKIIIGQKKTWDILLLGVVVGLMVQEYATITFYGRERIILLLVVFLAHSLASNRKTLKIRL